MFILQAINIAHLRGGRLSKTSHSEIPWVDDFASGDLVDELERQDAILLKERTI